MAKCPYCEEVIPAVSIRCPQCDQLLLEEAGKAAWEKLKYGGKLTMGLLKTIGPGTLKALKAWRRLREKSPGKYPACVLLSCRGASKLKRMKVLKGLEGKGGKSGWHLAAYSDRKLEGVALFLDAPGALDWWDYKILRIPEGKLTSIKRRESKKKWRFFHYDEGQSEASSIIAIGGIGLLAGLTLPISPLVLLGFGSLAVFIKRGWKRPTDAYAAFRKRRKKKRPKPAGEELSWWDELWG